MWFTTIFIAAPVLLFFGMLIFFGVGRRVALSRMKEDGEGAHAGISSIEGAVFGLLGLLVGFTFFGAAGRLDDRRELIVDEANRIGTAYRRLDLLPIETQPAVRDMFREYLDARLTFYRELEDTAAAEAAAKKVHALQGQIWKSAMEGTRLPGGADAGRLLLPALNEMIDIVTTRTMAMQMHPPLVVFGMLFGLSLASALLAGYGLAKAKRWNTLHAVGFALVMSLVVYVILDLEFPRMGLFRVDSFDQALVDLRATMK